MSELTVYQPNSNCSSCTSLRSDMSYNTGQIHSTANFIFPCFVPSHILEITSGSL